MRFLLLFIIVFQTHAQISDFAEISFSKADSIATIYNNEELNNLPLLAHNLTSNLDTDVERFRAIYKWVCTNIENDYGLFLKNKRKRNKYKNDSVKLNQWNIKFRKSVYKKLLKKNRTLCTGYAYLIKELSNLAGLDCEIINGYSKTSASKKTDFNMPNHSWNAIKLNNKWYLCDPTWSSGIITINEDGYTYDQQYNNGYFLTHPNLFALNHFPLDKKWMLIDEEDSSFETFLNAPIVYKKTFTKLAKHKTPETLNNVVGTNENITFEYKLLRPTKSNSIFFVIDNGFKTKKIQPKTVVIKNQLLQLKHQFIDTGLYDVHLYIEDALISSYTFNVKS